MERSVFLRNITLKNIASRWLSFSILKIIGQDTKSKFRKLEKVQEKLTKKQLDIEFNRKCIDNDLLPNYTNQYIYKIIMGIEAMLKEYAKSVLSLRRFRERDCITKDRIY